MSVYANKFNIQMSDVCRIICLDEQSNIAEGLPMPIKETANVVMTRENAKMLGELLVKLAQQQPPPKKP